VSAAVVDVTGRMRQLDKPASGSDRFTAGDAADAEKLARKVQSLEDRLTGLERAFRPRWIEFEDVAVGASGAEVRLPHGFGGRVRWEVRGWRTSSTLLWLLKEDTDATTDSVLVLLSYVAGTATIRVSEAG
jgi:hypothetical protein